MKSGLYAYRLRIVDDQGGDGCYDGIERCC